MTDPSSAPRRSRRRSGRHRQQPVRPAESTPLPPEQARRNRDAAFGAPNPKRTWIDTPAAPASAPSAPEPAVDEPQAGARAGEPQALGRRAAGRPSADERSADASASSGDPARGSSRTSRSEGEPPRSRSTGSLPHTAERRTFPGAGSRSSEPGAATAADSAGLRGRTAAAGPAGASGAGGAASSGAEEAPTTQLPPVAARPAAPGERPVERTTPRRPRGRRAAFPLDQLESSPAQSPIQEPAPAPRGRRAASASSASSASSTSSALSPASASSASSASEVDAWTMSAEDTGADAEAPLAPGTESAAVPPEPSEDAPAPQEGRSSSPGPRIVPGRRTSLAAGAAAGAAAAEAAASPSPSGPDVSAGPSPATAGASAASPAGQRSAGSADAPSPTDDGEGRDRPAAVAASSLGAAGLGSGEGRATGDGSGGGRDGGTGSGDSGDGGNDDEGTPTGDGSLAKVAGWTVLTSALPGTGLVTTPLRRIGVVLLALLLLTGATIAAVLVIGDPLRLAATLGTHRGVLIGALVVAVVVGLVWCLQIVLANLAQTTKQRLEGAKRYLALALAAVMVIAVAVPFGRGVQSLWALQGLFGSTTVFGGDSGELAEGPDPWADTPRLNIMLLGQDAGADRTGTRPDTLMVASIDTKTGQTALFSIPRNLENVEFPEGTVAAEEFPDGFDYYGKNENLINAVWAWAEEHPDLFPGDPEPGLTATRWAVEETLGISTDYYAMVNLKGFEDLVNALGGVDLVVERRIPIGGGAADVEGYIEPGEQKLDGFHALWYARSREGSDDFNRMCRQQRIVRAVSEEADPTSLALSIPRLVTATEENIQTDIPVGNVDAFVELALRIKDGGFTSYPITQDVTFSGNPDWEYLEEWVDASIEDSVKQDPPESVQGETEPGSTEPADTGAPPEEDTSAPEDTTSEETTTEETTTEESTTEEESSSTEGGTDEEATPTDAPEIEQDPLKSCLPGGGQ